MKKILLASLMFILTTSCNQEDFLEESTTTASSAQLVSRINPGIAPSFPAYLDLDPAILCKNSQEEGTTISLNPTYTYIDTYNVIAQDGGVSNSNCPNNGKYCIDLSHFLVLNGAYLDPAVDVGSVQRIPFYYGASQEYNFNNYNAGSSSDTWSFRIGDYGYSLFYGGINGYMSNDAANTILQTFRNDIKNYMPTQNGQQPKIKAVHFMYNEWLCGYKEIKMTLKYTY